MQFLLMIVLAGLVPVEWQPGCWGRMAESAIAAGITTVEANRAFLHDKIRAFVPCRLTGPAAACVECGCDCWDIDGDNDIDLKDVAELSNWLSDLDGVTVSEIEVVREERDGGWMAVLVPEGNRR